MKMPADIKHAATMRGDEEQGAEQLRSLREEPAEQLAAMRRVIMHCKWDSVDAELLSRCVHDIAIILENIVTGATDGQTEKETETETDKNIT